MIEIIAGFIIGIALNAAAYVLGRRHGEARAYLELLSAVTPKRMEAVLPPLKYPDKPMFPDKKGG